MMIKIRTFLESKNPQKKDKRLKIESVQQQDPISLKFITEYSQ